MTNLVILKNGESLPEPVINSALMSLKKLLSNDPIGFYELVALCRDESHKLFGNYAASLGDLALISDGRPTDLIKMIVLESTEGEGLDLKLVSPYAQQQKNGCNLVKVCDIYDSELFKLMHKVADIVFEYCIDYYAEGPDNTTSVGERVLPWKEDWRKTRKCNPYNEQTNGLFLEFYYGTPSSLWTPWGIWKFCGSGSGSWNIEAEPGKSLINKILERTGAVIFAAEQEVSMGCFGPVYGLHRVAEAAFN